MRARGSTIFFFECAYRSDSYEKEIGGQPFRNTLNDKVKVYTCGSGNICHLVPKAI
jgi:hypothetical protein